MKFHATPLAGLWSIELEPRSDERGFLARTYCEKEFAAAGLNTRWPQCNLTLTRQKGSIRGLHFQAEPQPEIKLIRCVAGAIFDVVVDVRAQSDTFGQWAGFELTPHNGRQLYVPGGFAHGFQCLTDDCQVFYQMSAEYVPDLARGLRQDDPQIGIRWPLPVAQISERDASLPLLQELPSA
jgi:dTDP-4-dehydrorhamnose 3,5-epimerase